MKNLTKDNLKTDCNKNENEKKKKIKRVLGQQSILVYERLLILIKF